MIANFHINYITKPGEAMAIRFKQHGVEVTVICQSVDNSHWHFSTQLPDNEQVIYKYFLQTDSGLVGEHGEFRSVDLPSGASHVFFQDYWRPQFEVARSFFSAAFKDVIFKRKTANTTPPAGKSKGANKIRFQLYAAAIPQHLRFCILGNNQALGNWEKPLILSDSNFPCWQVDVDWATTWADIEYKFALYNPENQQIVEWETGENRHLNFSFPSSNGNAVVRTDESYRYASGLWRGAGMAIPVFSLRSENGCGIGEFTDLNLLVDWAAKTGMKVVQTLPVNDTIATKTWTDSYPYAAISVYALHPLYVNIQSIAKLKNKADENRLREDIAKLNKLETVDFEKVLNTKIAFFELLWAQEKQAFFKDQEAQNFIEANANWLKPYAAFCHLRDLNGTTNFHQWRKFATYSPKVIAELCDPKYKAFDEVAFYFFIQFHAHKQLLGATNYARKNGVVLKGDLPIGIYRESCDAWVAPHLYNMDGQAGAPPDAYSEAGQNWGFPTYNWEVMAKDGFAWWQQRMTKLAEYFDALRIDHILGFFRIWQIPTNQVEGTLGLFNPRLPYSRQELASMGLHGELHRYTKPYIRGHFLGEMFGKDAEFVCKTFLDETTGSIFRLKDFVDNQLKIKQLFAKDEKLAKKKHLELPLMRLVSNVLLIEEEAGFNPRITLENSRSFQDLSEQEKGIFKHLYNDYFYVRHDEFWRQQALWKLPALLQATNMLICGEDLGMVPHSVAGVMHDLNILSLEIQRMPKGLAQFGDPAKYPYASVCSPSCHDMPTIRGWWESDYQIAQKFYKNCLRQFGQAPEKCSPEIVEAVNWQHLDSPSMLAIFPVQDLVGMDAELRRPVASEETINDPSITPHYWRFRFHLPIERLLEEEGLNAKIREMVREAGR
jgi:4-alpha-glucanotransferase